MFKRSLLATAVVAGLAALPGVAEASCAFKNPVQIKALAAAFDAWKAVSAAWGECGNVQAELDMDFRKKQPTAFKATPSLYQIGGVANNTIVPLLNDGTIRPLDDLVAKYGQQLSPNQLIKVDGKIMAIAMMVNAQHFMVREDILKELNIPIPTTWDEVLDAAAKIKASGKVQYPLGATMKPGFDISQEFLNLFLGFGGQVTKADNTPSINSEAGMKTLAMMKRISEYLDPEFLSSESSFVAKQFQQGKIAMAQAWASRAGATINPAESPHGDKIKMIAAPAAVKGGKPATTLWWDGFVIAKNIPDAEAEAAFKVALEGIDEEMVTANNAAAVWLIKGYKPGRAAEGAIASAMGGAPAYPSTSAMGLISASLAENVADFMSGKKTAEQTLQAIEAAYLTRAKEQGLVK